MGGDTLDRSASRSISAIEDAFWYVVAAVSYVTLGVSHKWLLNWFVGPVWLVTIVVIGPRLVDRVARWWRRGPGRR